MLRTSHTATSGRYEMYFSILIKNLNKMEELYYGKN